MQKSVTRRKFLKTAGLILGSLALDKNLVASEKEKKNVVLCFDGNKGVRKWQWAIDLGNQLSDLNGEAANFSVYGNSCVWFSHLPGGSNIGYGGKQEDIDKCLEITQRGINLGHELGSHAVRHLHGDNWNYNQWLDELSEFDEHTKRLLKDVNGNPYKSVGFRAPYLEWNDDMFKALGKLGYKYDISIPTDEVNEKHGVKSLGCPIWTRPSGRSVLGMDYNWMVAGVSNNELEKMLESESLKRDPFVIALHFSDYKKEGESNPYCNVVKDFMIKGAKEGRFVFPSMIEYLQSKK